MPAKRAAMKKSAGTSVKKVAKKVAKKPAPVPAPDPKAEHARKHIKKIEGIDSQRMEEHHRMTRHKKNQ